MPKFNLFYAGYNKKLDEEQLGAVYSNNLLEWKGLQSPIISISRGKNTQISNPCVLKFGSSYYMWFQTKDVKGGLGICFAESKDLKNWEIDFDPILSLKSEKPQYREGFHHPHVIFDQEENIFKMWCIFYQSGESFLAYTESNDGKKWKEPVKLFGVEKSREESKIFYPFVLKKDDKYNIWYTVKDISGYWSLYTRVSNDGKNWSAQIKLKLGMTKIPLILRKLVEIISSTLGVELKIPLYGIGSPNIWVEGENYFLIGHEYGTHGKLYIPLYQSIDGINWKKKKNNILEKMRLENWNIFFQGDPFMFIENERK